MRKCSNGNRVGRHTTDGREDLLSRLQRYPKQSLAEHTDADFAGAVWEAVDMLCDLFNEIDELVWEKMKKEQQN